MILTHEIISSFLLNVHYFVTYIFHINLFRSFNFSSQLLHLLYSLKSAFFLSYIYLITAWVTHGFLYVITIMPISLFGISNRVLKHFFNYLLSCPLIYLFDWICVLSLQGSPFDIYFPNSISAFWLVWTLFTLLLQEKVMVGIDVCSYYFFQLLNN